MSLSSSANRQILTVLKRLEFDGCPSATETGTPTTPPRSFDFGVPAVLLKACVPGNERDLTKNIQLLLRRKMIQEARLKSWWLGRETRFLLDQDVVIIQAWQGGFSLARQTEARFEPAGGMLPKYPGTGMGLKVFIGRQRGKHLINARVFPAWHAKDWGPVYLIEAAGLEALEPAPAEKTVVPQDEPEEWLTVTQAAKMLLTDVSGIDIQKAKSRVSYAATDGKFRTNGKMGLARRIEHKSFCVWRLQQRDRDLDQVDSGDRPHTSMRRRRH